jgi:hypothetical protein
LRTQAVKHSLGAAESYNTAQSLEAHHLSVALEVIDAEGVDLLGELDALEHAEFRQIVATLISEPRIPPSFPNLGEHFLISSSRKLRPSGPFFATSCAFPER